MATAGIDAIEISHGSELFRTCLGQYLDTEDPDMRIHYASALAVGDEPEERLTAAEMFLELAASDQLTDDEREAMFHSAQTQYEAVITHGSTYGLMGDTQLKAQDRSATATSLFKITVEEQLPDLTLVGEEFDKSLEAVARATASYDQLPKADVRTMNGVLSELGVRLLLSRFAIRNSLEGYVPVTTFISQDLGDIHHTEYYVNRWDISVLTPFGESECINIAHKIQVKTGGHKQGRVKSYGSDIKVVRVSDELRLGKKPLKPTTIPDQLRREQQKPDDYVTSLLDKRTDLLLDIIDANSG